MAPKLPGKFDDISKAAASVLGDDYQSDGYQFKSKSKMNVGGGSAELAVDLLAKGDVATPTKLTFKFPSTPFQGLSIDKFEMDKKGAGKLECSLTKALHKVDGLKVDVKSDFKCAEPLAQAPAYAATYTGIADTSVKVEAKQASIADPTIECLHGRGAAVIGAKLDGFSNLCPSVGVNFKSGDLFLSLIAKNKFSEFTLHNHYKVKADIDVAATYQYGGKKTGTWAIGGSAKVADGTAKAKFESSNDLSLSYKKDLAKGTTLLAGCKFNVGDSALTYGAKLSVE